MKAILKERNCKEISRIEHFNSFVARDYKCNYQIKKYADKLKDIVCLLIGCTREQLEDREFKEKELGEEWWVWESTIKGNYTIFPYTNQNMDSSYWNLVKLTPRKLLQLLGTECGRQIIHPNIWVNALFADYNPKFKGVEYDDLNEYYPNWIITDVRFPNEAKAIKDRGGIVIRVNRAMDSMALQKGSVMLNEVVKHISVEHHPSETALDDYKFDAVIDNNGSIEELVEKVKQLKLV